MRACIPYPTLIVQLEDMQSDLVRFTYKLYAELGDAGIAGLQMPARHAMNEHFGTYLMANHTRTHVKRDQPTRLTRTQVRWRCLCLGAATDACMCITLTYVALFPITAARHTEGAHVKACAIIAKGQRADSLM